MLCRLALALVCGLALTSPSLARAHPAPAPPIVLCQYCGPAVAWSRLGDDSRFLFNQYPLFENQRAFYARTPDETHAWTKYIDGRDRAALSRLNFSKYGVLAFFHVIHPVPPLRVDGVNSVEPDGLHATLRSTPCQLYRVCASFAQYVLIRIRKSSLQGPVRRVFVTEVEDDPAPPSPSPDQPAVSTCDVTPGSAPPPCISPAPPPVEVSFNSFGAGSVPIGAPWSKNRVYFAAGIEDTARWFRYVSRADRAKLRQLNFSHFAVFAIFLASPLPFDEFTVQRMYSLFDGLYAEIRVIPFCSHCTGPAPTIPPSGWGSYVLVTMERATLQSPVPSGVYVSELPLPDR